MTLSLQAHSHEFTVGIHASRSSLPRLPLAFKGKVSLESVHEAKILEKAHKIQSCEMQGLIGK
jgi:hypothetical protein